MNREETSMDEIYDDSIFYKDLSEIDPDIDRIIAYEEDRQANKLILIPSESMASLAVRQALGSVFNNIYAEGYPPSWMGKNSEEELLDFNHQLSHYRRYGDRRFYKGCDYAHFVESLARRRVAECFANGEVGVDDIYANVQPLSGAAANNAVYEAFVQPGDVVMGMSLGHGGHLTHGSRFNRSGKRYRIVSYEVDPKTEKLDYDHIKALALEHKPKMIIAGYTSYPWAPDWGAFREIADAVGAVLMADIAHPAGMVVAGCYPTPVGFADVITFTTHKTLCGPRGAVILTSDERVARKIDSSVFPGEQGGPHVNKFAAMAVAFKIAKTAKFKRLQEKIVENASCLADALTQRGLRLSYGGTDTHLLCVDLRVLADDSAYPLKGEVAARILDLCGIVVNKNTIPGDETAAEASGIRLGTPWITQRGLGPVQMEKLAELIHRVTTSIRPFSYQGPRGDLPRGKIDLEISEGVKSEVAEMIDSVEPKADQGRSLYPHYAPPHLSTATRETALGSVHREAGAEMGASGPWDMPIHYGDPEGEIEAASRGGVLFDLGDMGLLQITGERAGPFLGSLATSDVGGLSPGECGRAFLLNKKGELIDDVTVYRHESEGNLYWILTNPERNQIVKAWLRAISDGYTLFDDDDVLAKIEGPVSVEDLAESPKGSKRTTTLSLQSPKAEGILKKLGLEISKNQFREVEVAGVWAYVSRVSYGTDVEGYEFFLNPEDAASLWQALKEVGGRPAGICARNKLRSKSGLPIYGEEDSPIEGLSLYKNGHQDMFYITKPYLVGQGPIRAGVKPSTSKGNLDFTPANGDLKRTRLYEQHVKLTKRMVPFAGWEMPVWYTSIGEEHRAVRTAAGLFDIGHMGVLEVGGSGATSFLDLVCTNYVRLLEDGVGQYSYVLDPDGAVIDDVIIYRRSPERFMVVVNASNAEMIESWFKAVLSGEVVIDREHTYIEFNGDVTIRNMKDDSSKGDRRVDLALQGPKSLSLLKRIASSPQLGLVLEGLKKFHFVEGELSGVEAIVSRTGYTGENIGFELYVRPEDTPKLWNDILEAGGDDGIKPAGLGARDSTRTEAGFPLYGHELGGEHDVSPLGAGYGAFVKFHKPYFIGRKALLERENKRRMEIVRFRMAKGSRAIRPDDPVVSRRGVCVGNVTSSVLVEGRQLGLAYVDRNLTQEATTLAIFPLPRGSKADGEKPKDQLSEGDKVILPEEAVVLSRFMVSGVGTSTTE